MNKKELARAKRALKSGAETVERIAACYVPPDKHMYIQDPVPYAMVPNEEAETYLTLFRKALTGAFGRGLHTVEFSQSAEGEGTGHDLLMAVRDSALKDPELNARLFQQIASSYAYEDPYCMLALYATLSLPSGRDEDVMGDIDANDNLYRYILLCICPTAQAKPALEYSMSDKKIAPAHCGWILGAPAFGLLFPALTGGTPDIHAMLCHTKKQDEVVEDLVSGAFQCTLPLGADMAQEHFSQMLQETLGQQCSYENLSRIQGRLQAMAETGDEDADEEDVPTVGQQQFVGLVRECVEDLPEETIVSAYQAYFGEQPVRVDQLVQNKTVLKGTEFVINCTAEAAEKVKIMQVNGRRCIVLPPDGQVEVNGVTIV